MLNIDSLEPYSSSKPVTKFAIISSLLISVPRVYAGMPSILTEWEVPIATVSRSSRTFAFFEEGIILESQCKDASFGTFHWCLQEDAVACATVRLDLSARA